MTSPTDIRLQIAVLASAGPALDELPPVQGIEWLTCVQVDAHRIEFMRQGQATSALDFRNARFDLPGLLAIIVVGDAAYHRVLRERWSSSFPFVRLDIKLVSECNVVAIVVAAAACLADNLADQRLHSGRAAMDLAVYRREFERLQRNFSRLEEYVSEHSLRKPVVLFECPAAPLGVTNGAGPPANANSQPGEPVRVQQLLPVDSLGVSGLALAVRCRVGGSSPLHVRLFALENEQTFGAWSIQPADVPVGWLQLTLSRAIDVPALSLVVSVELPPGLDGFALALAQPHPYAEYRARIEGGEPLHAPLALRIYGSLPGVRVPGIMTAFAPSESARSSVTLIPPEICNSVRQVFPPLEGGKSKFVVYDEALGSITVHPHDGGVMTVARIDLVAPEDAWRFSAQIALEHELAKPTEFALLALPLADELTEAALAGNLDGSSISFSGWMGVAALERKRLSVFFPKVKDNALSIYLLTRQSPDSSSDYAWARFGKFEFNSPPGSLSGPRMALRTDMAAEHQDASVPNGAAPADTPDGTLRNAGSL